MRRGGYDDGRDYYRQLHQYSQTRVVDLADEVRGKIVWDNVEKLLKK